MDQNKRRARTLEERFPNGPPKVRLGPKGHWISNNHVFNDHTGKAALMSWQSISVKCPLPPLASWVYYMVHPDVPRDFDGCAFHSGLTDGSSCGRGGRFRYEFFFLPGATAEECAAHFRGELEARGTIWRYIRKVERAMKLKKQESGQEEHDSGEGSGPDEEDTVSSQESNQDQDDTASSHLPGLVWTKSDRHCSNQLYRGYFFMYTDAEIETRGADGEARHVYLVKFDPIPQEWLEDEDEDGDLNWDLNPMKHPVNSQRLKVRDQDFERSLGGWMEMEKGTHWEQEADHATGTALELGWESW